LTPLTKDIGQIFKRFRKVTARFALHRQANDEKAEFGNVQPTGRFPHGLFERLTQSQAIGNAPEFNADRRADFRTNGFDRLGNRQT